MNGIRSHAQLMLAAFAGAVLALGLQASFLDAQKEKAAPTVQEEVRTKALVVVDAEGRKRAEIDRHGLTVYDEDELAAAMYYSSLCTVMGVDDSSRVLITGEKVEIQAPDNARTLILSPSSISGTVGVSKGDETLESPRVLIDWSSGVSLALKDSKETDRFLAKLSEKPNEVRVSVHGADGTTKADLK